MICPYCGYKSHVVNSRSHSKQDAVWRRRECIKCLSIWTTDEKYELSTTHRVFEDKTSDFEPFQRDKLFVSILDSLRHRKRRTQEAGAITDTIINKILHDRTAIIKTTKIQELTYKTLRLFDPTAAAVYNATHFN